MATEEKQKDEAESAEGAQEARRAIIFELEGIAVDSRSVLFEAVKNAVASYDKELTRALFSRFCMNATVEKFVPKLCEFLDISSRSTDKIIKAVNESVDAFWKTDDRSYRVGLESLLMSARQKGFELVAITTLTKKAASAALKGLNPEVGAVDIHSFADQDRVVAGADIWMQVAADRDLNPGICIGLASCGKGCKAILAADLHCIAVPDAFTEFEDYSGARFMFDSLESIVIDELVAEFYEKD